MWNNVIPKVPGSAEPFEVIAYIPDLDRFICIDEGDGGNLSWKDEQNGYVDYAYIESYAPDGCEDEGGILLLEELYVDKYPRGDLGKRKQLVSESIDLCFGMDARASDFIIIKY